MNAFKKPIRLLLTLCLLAQLVFIPSFAADTPVYLALGDSISTGYGLSETDPSFVEQLADCYPDFTLVNQAVNGNTPAGVYEQLKDGALDSYLTRAELITLTCGGNDLIGSLYQQIANKYNAANPSKPITGTDVLEIMANKQTDTSYYPAKSTLFKYAIAVLPGFANSQDFEDSLTAFTSSLTQVMQYIREKNSTAEILVTTQYNPYVSFQKSGAYRQIYKEVEAGVLKLNEIITTNASVLGYTVADVYTAFTSSDDNLCNAHLIPDDYPNIDFHPNAAGHTLIKDVILDLDRVFSFAIDEEKSSLSDGTVTVSLTAVDSPVNVIAAFYNSDNRMIGSDMVAVSDSNLQATLSAKFTGTASRVQVFLLDSTSFAPLQQSLSWSGN